MTDLFIAATLVLSLATLAALILPGSEARRLALLAGIVTTLLLPIAAKLVGLAGLATAADAHRLGASSAVWESSACGRFFVTVWIAGGALMAARLGWQAFLAFRLARLSRALVAGEAAAVCQTLKLPMDEVARRFRIADSIDSPLVLAGPRQTVLLPPTWPRWSASLRASALRHEWRHVLTADAQWAVVAALLRVVFWFHPLARWVCERWAEQCEMLADQAAASGRTRADYAQELLSLATVSCSDAHAFATAFTPRTRSRLERRVRAVLEGTSCGLPCGRIVRLLLLLAFSAAGISLATMLAPRRSIKTGALEAEAQTRLIANPFPADP